MHCTIALPVSANTFAKDNYDQPHAPPMCVVIYFLIDDLRLPLLRARLEDFRSTKLSNSILVGTLTTP